MFYIFNGSGFPYKRDYKPLLHAMTRRFFYMFEFFLIFFSFLSLFLIPTWSILQIGGISEILEFEHIWYRNLSVL